jgi:hypothetical protein
MSAIGLQVGLLPQTTKGRVDECVGSVRRQIANDGHLDGALRKGGRVVGEEIIAGDGRDGVERALLPGGHRDGQRRRFQRKAARRCFQDRSDRGECPP